MNDSSPDKEQTQQELEEQRLAEGVKAGRPEVFEELFELYGDKLYGFGLRMCGNADDAAELVQEIFLNAFRAHETFRGDSRVLTWLYRIANNSCLMKRRKGKFEPDVTLSLEELHPAHEEAGEVPLPDWSQDPLMDAQRSEVLDRVKEALLELPAKYRIVIVMRDMQGFSTEETAEALDLSEAAVKSRLHRARIFVRNALSDLHETVLAGDLSAEASHGMS